MKQGDYVQIYKDPIQRTEKECMATLQKKVAETDMLEIWEVELRPSGKVETRNLLKPKTIMIVNMFCRSFITSRYGGLADMRDVQANIENGWRIVDAKPANSGEGLELHLEGYHAWIKTPRGSDEW